MGTIYGAATVVVLSRNIERNFKLRHYRMGVKLIAPRNRGWRRASAALRFEKWSTQRGPESNSVDEQMESIHGRDKNGKSHGCVRHAPADL